MAERYIPEHRRTQFKAKGTFKPEELRRRREEQQVEIRKAKREENLAKRRGLTGGDASSRPGASLGAAPDSDDDTAPTESQVRGTNQASTVHIFALLPSFPGAERMLRQNIPPILLFCLLFAFCPAVGNYFRLWVGFGCHQLPQSTTMISKHIIVTPLCKRMIADHVLLL
jgi:hypothetical protein